MVDATRGGRNAAALAILALSALLLTPFFFQRTIARQRASYTGSLDPARAAASDVLLALAKEVGSIRGYLLTGDSALLTDYRIARSGQERALARLAALPKDDSAMARQSRLLDSTSREWNELNDRVSRGMVPRAEAIALLGGQQAKYRAALDAGEALEDQLVRSVSDLRERVAEMERRWAIATWGLAIVAAAAAAIVVFMMRVSHKQSALARTDPLTGLYNRLGFDELATRELSRARRNRAAITLLSFDLDGFKQVNDARGHGAGDNLLRSVGNAIRAAIRDIDVAGRLGGDEFAVLLPDNRANPPELAVERVRGVILAALEREQWPVTLSIGAVTSHNTDATIDEMIHSADTLMYRVKNAGKNALRHENISASR
jgi:diguanylate cyclase (GGDEF)-like protein